MAGEQLFIFVEGPSDEKLINEVVKPVLEKRLGERDGSVVVRQYAHLRKETMNSLLAGIEADGHDYLLFADIESARCVTARKEALQQKFSKLDLQKVIVVVRLIEGWYLGGLDVKGARTLKVAVPQRTDRLTKEEFNTLRPKNFKSGTTFMTTILKYFDVETAKRKNTSFSYFAEKYLAERL